MTSKEIRDNFLNFFAGKGHTVVPSAPMVVKDDPTLMFTNAGMNQFKDWFLGNEPAKYPRVADTQKCLRVSGKHNDLEEVGHDSYHHTMFEMLGNWSFGDYFKNEAIDWAWELLTEVYKLDKDRLYATVFEGSPEEGIGSDQEARERWLRYLPAERILNGNKKDNFWEMGDTGPCGPCSEIHVDIRSDEERAALPGSELVNKGHHLVIEIWNLVFIQYNRKASGELVPLPQKHVDTGMGLERLCMAMQGKKSNYDTDVFSNMIAKISELCGKEYGKDAQTDVAMRVIADHIRAISFSIADGQLPSNVKAGYVIRRILRRAVRYAYTFLGVDEPFLCRLVPTLVGEMGSAFPELKKQQELVTKVIKEEEESFLRTLGKGIKLMDNLMAKYESTKVIPGEDAFILYDTYGFPPDLSELIAREHGFSIDTASFEKELEKQKERSRNATSSEEGDWIEVRPYTGVEFTGYENTVEQVQITRYRSVKTKNKELFQIVLDKSPFYAESGGQVGDTGYLESPAGEKIAVINTVKENNLIIHIAEKMPSDAAQTFTARIDEEKRQSTANNHTATHLLHKALREILGTHIEQKGSLVSSTYFRFDFSHFERVTPEILRKVESRVNELIRENAGRDEFRDMPVEKAKAMGAMALFGEKYGDHVRVIRFGDSIELCGGTHTSATGNIGLFKIISESAIAAGVRRIEATTGSHAESLVHLNEDIISSLKALFNNSPNLVSSITKLVEENDSFKKKVEEFMRERAEDLRKQLSNEKQYINGLNVVTLRGEYHPEVVKNVAMMFRSDENTVMIAGFSFEGKANLAVMYTDDLVAHGCNAGKDIREASKLINGGGGGQPFFATAGGKNPEGISAAIAKLIELATK
ncbi:MAG: alanine--tRNA ligase [Bacteroidetes bacterium HGW-Bacteroidetes-14]|jgi:alanyl-tRNA synthetase|nr:MAG: alanine--tRNA ligase [Bacteroidetes bacterium HGW-Bacteroidetes-14]